MTLVGLYAGIGGFELGFQAAGFKTSLLADKDEYCREVLKARFPGIPVEGDVGELGSLPVGTTVVTAGFPCQNLSMAGDKAGMGGAKSGDVRHLFELLKFGGPTLAIENVYFMLHLKKGEAMESLVGEVEALGYKWAYRVVNTLAFGLPQRRRRVFFVAAMHFDPWDALFADEAGKPSAETPTVDRPIGFYWTEGRKGLGLAVDAIPPLKVASGLGIPSAPAVLFPDGKVLTPDIESCERLQGFDQGWTGLDFGVKRSPRWTMIGNAISVPAAEWLAGRIRERGSMLDLPIRALQPNQPWPSAAYGAEGQRYAVEVSEYPVQAHRASIDSFRTDAWKALSARALAGFISRARLGGLKLPTGFMAQLEIALEKARADLSKGQ